MIGRIKEIYKSRELLKNLTSKELKLKYKNSALGFIWSFFNPLMMMVVYTLAEMVAGGTAITLSYLLVVVIGNAFVMCLEGMIVGIQVLRLEFYEMFSRYYEGKGKPFISIKER